MELEWINLKYDSIDSLESKDDLELLFNLLDSIKDVSALFQLSL